MGGGQMALETNRKWKTTGNDINLMLRPQEVGHFLSALSFLGSHLSLSLSLSRPHRWLDQH